MSTGSANKIGVAAKHVAGICCSVPWRSDQVWSSRRWPALVFCPLSLSRRLHCLLHRRSQSLTNLGRARPSTVDCRLWTVDWIAHVAVSCRPAMSPFRMAVVLGALALAGGCNTREEQPQFRPTATVKDIMLSVIDPEADVLWNSVATIVSASGTEEREPRTDEEWATLRRSAIQLVEATNLLRVPGRLVARPGEKSENPRIELQPETIQKMIAEDPAGWSALVDRLHDAAAPALKAIDARDVKGLFDAGDQIEHACEACHQRYWYPPAAASAWKHEPGGRLDDSASPAPV